MRAHRLMFLIPAVAACLALGACGSSPGAGGGQPAVTVPAGGGPIDAALLQKICRTRDASRVEAAERPAEDNNYANAVKGVAESLAEKCREAGKP